MKANRPGEKVTNVHLVSFGDSSMITSRRRLRAQAKKIGVFKTINLADEKALPHAFRRKHADLLTRDVRGFGYWIWKPQIVLSELEKIPDGELLVYCDMGFYINESGRDILLDWLRRLTSSDSDFLVFQSLVPEKYPEYDGRALPDYRDAIWTKGDLLDYFDARDSRLIFEPTIHAGLIIIRRSTASLSVIREWRNVMSENLNLIDDSPSVSPNLEGFRENRHDQSVFSLLMKRDGSYLVESSNQFWYPKIDDIYDADWDAIDRSPFQARRDKSRGRTGVNQIKFRVAKLYKKLFPAQSSIHGGGSF